ncbi:hypothetical protein N0V84_003117 [Fusarium piperis]|uniref:Uncharacterized protein n=1 Tax=Fusarium piperis TaxID=1435070 RepID=A0A9W8WI16_9HYPO|nr:hypothetical protein N0V84_003117 [Fusarium piperis]
MAKKLNNRAEQAKPAQRDTQKDACWISKALDDEMTCREHRQYFSTIVYTRGELQKPAPGPNARTDVHLRGTIRVVPPEKSCILDCPIVVKEGIPGCSPQKENYSKEELSHYFATRLHVYDRFKGEEYMDRLLDKAQDIIGDLQKRVSDELSSGDGIDALDAALEKLTIVDFTKVIEETPLLTTRLLDNIPFSIDLFGGKYGPNAQAWTRRLKPNDTLLECQHMRHLMIRQGDGLLAWTAAGSVRRTFSRIPLLMVGDIDHVSLERYCHDRDALFDLQWSLFSNLESLCLDLRGIHEGRRKSIEALFVKMGRHLRLKTLVLIGVPHLIDFDSVGSKEYVAQQEDDEFLVFPGDKHNPSTELTNYIHFLKKCLRPSGELRLIVPNPQT